MKEDVIMVAVLFDADQSKPPDKIAKRIQDVVDKEMGRLSKSYRMPFVSSVKVRYLDAVGQIIKWDKS